MEKEIYHQKVDPGDAWLGGVLMWLKESGPSPETDGGALVRYLGSPLKFGYPKKFYEHASPPEGDKYFQWGKKYLLSEKAHPEGRLEKMTQMFPEKYAQRALAWLALAGQVNLDNEHTGAVISKMCEQISEHKPISLAMIYSLQKFPLAEPGIDIKCVSPDPDIAELSLLHSLWSVSQAIWNEVYPYGVKITIYNESWPFKHFPSPYGADGAGLRKFENTVKKWTEMLGWGNTISFGDLDLECQKKPGYADSVRRKFDLLMGQFADMKIGQNPFLRAEARNVYWPGLGLFPTQEMLMNFYSVFGEAPLPGIACESGQAGSDVGEGYKAKIIAQAKYQAAYSRAFLDTRAEFGGIYGNDEIPVTITKADNKITVPVVCKKAQEAMTHWNGGGVTIFPTAGTGIMTPNGIAILPAYRALTVSESVKHSNELNLYYLNTEG